ncbi:NusG domain II-containing protein [Brevibacillus laterosporus]|uniref:NusG domain II-containing protein n=1 Tax=Brevibacillus laterosporus TaxID=1465 RepID=A0A518V7F8_BRELA|nr:NusG domain II-containing protein [Brevibacillus laterosporus]QDX92914.1 NusG domain II-containing protein [Brevibacillus laterosporus]TPG71270.1 NusG domain II-containing protein [Brevibacillus laterosporus]
MKRADLILIGIVLVVALVFLVPRYYNTGSSENLHNVHKVAKITVNNQLYKTIELTKEEQIITVDTDHGQNILKVHDFGIEMFEADCDDKVCLSFGFITEPSQTIVCLPHRVLVEIISDEGADIDGLAQ